jgi:hypothetical protein
MSGDSPGLHASRTTTALLRRLQSTPAAWAGAGDGMATGSIAVRDSSALEGQRPTAYTIGLIGAAATGETLDDIRGVPEVRPG